MGRDQRTFPAMVNRNPISIHSPRMGRDMLFYKEREAHSISIHSPRMGRDLIIRNKRS